MTHFLCLVFQVILVLALDHVAVRRTIGITYCGSESLKLQWGPCGAGKLCTKVDTSECEAALVRECVGEHCRDKYRVFATAVYLAPGDRSQNDISSFCELTLSSPGRGGFIAVLSFFDDGGHLANTPGPAFWRLWGVSWLIAVGKRTGIVVNSFKPYGRDAMMVDVLAGSGTIDAPFAPSSKAVSFLASVWTGESRMALRGVRALRLRRLENGIIGFGFRLIIRVPAAPEGAAHRLPAQPALSAAHANREGWRVDWMGWEDKLQWTNTVTLNVDNGYVMAPERTVSTVESGFADGIDGAPNVAYQLSLQEQGHNVGEHETIAAPLGSGVVLYHGTGTLAFGVKLTLPAPSRRWALTYWGQEMHSVDCRVSAWGSWSKCSRSCGRGYRHQRRQILLNPSAMGRACPERTLRSRSAVCATQACAERCVVGKWGKWQGCGASARTRVACGSRSDRVGHRTRTVRRATMSERGVVCPSLQQQQRPCPDIDDACVGRGPSHPCGGIVTKPNWRTLGVNGGEASTAPIFADIDSTTEGCVFSRPPIFVASVQVQPPVVPVATGHMTVQVNGTKFRAVIWHPTHGGVVLLRLALRHRWQISWIGDGGRNCGITPPGTSGWLAAQQHDLAAGTARTAPAMLLRLNVDARASHFSRMPPVFVTALYGVPVNSDRRPLQGVHAVYNATVRGFTVFVAATDAPIAADDVEARGWYVGWCGFNSRSKVGGEGKIEKVVWSSRSSSHWVQSRHFSNLMELDIRLAAAELVRKTAQTGAAVASSGMQRTVGLVIALELHGTSPRSGLFGSGSVQLRSLHRNGGDVNATTDYNFRVCVGPPSSAAASAESTRHGFERIPIAALEGWRVGYIAVENMAPQPKRKNFVVDSTTVAPSRGLKRRWLKTGSIDSFPLSMSSKNIFEKHTTTSAFTASRPAPDALANLTAGHWTTINFVLQVKEIGSRLQQLSKVQVQLYVSRAIKHALRHEAEVIVSASIVQFVPVLLLQLTLRIGVMSVKHALRDIQSADFKNAVSHFLSTSLYSSSTHFRIAITNPKLMSTTPGTVLRATTAAAMALRNTSPQQTQTASFDRQHDMSDTHAISTAHKIATPVLFAAASAIGVLIACTRGRRYHTLHNSEVRGCTHSAEEARVLIMADVAKRIAEAERLAEQASGSV